jgi:hypothetical protein
MIESARKLWRCRYVIDFRNNLNSWQIMHTYCRPVTHLVSNSKHHKNSTDDDDDDDDTTHDSMYGTPTADEEENENKASEPTNQSSSRQPKIL